MRNKNPAIIQHLAFISVKYDVYLEELYRALGSAKADGKSRCENLSIQYRGTIKNEAIFLITKEREIVGQFRVEENLLNKKDLHFESWMNTKKIHDLITKQNTVAPLSILIRDLRHGMKKVNVEAKVIEIQEPHQVHTQFGTMIKITNAIVADETGKIKLCLWGNQPNRAVVGDLVQIKNASVRTYNGEKQLNLGQSGSLTIIRNHIDNSKQPL